MVCHRWVVRGFFYGDSIDGMSDDRILGELECIDGEIDFYTALLEAAKEYGYRDYNIPMYAKLLHQLEASYQILLNEAEKRNIVDAVE